MIQKQKTIWIVVALLALLTGGVLLLPTLFSTAPLNKIVVNTLNRQVAPAELSIGKMNLGWFSEQKADGVRYQHEEAGVQADIDSVVIEKSLLGMLFSRTGLGLIRLESPRMVVPLKTISDFESERPDDPEEKPDEGELDQDIAKSLGQILSAWGSASFNGGQVFGLTKEGEKILLLDQVQLDTAVQRKTSQATVKLSAKSGRDDGLLFGDVVVTIPEDGVFKTSSFVGKGKLTLTDWNLDELLPLAALISDEVPFGRGHINGEWQMENPSEYQLQVTGTLKAKNIALYGGFLKKDQPKITDLACNINAFRKEGKWSVRQFDFTTPLGTGNASGFQKKVTGNRQFKLDSQINIAPTLAQFPNMLKIRNDLKITNGSMKVIGNITQADDRTLFEGQLRFSRLEGQQGKRKFVWKKPLTITGQGSYSADRWVVDRAKISSPFINGDGYANPDQMKGHLTVDAAKTFKQAGQFFKLPPVALEGLLETKFTANKKGAVWELDVKAASEDLGVLSQKKVLLAAAPFHLHVTSQYQAEAGNYLFTTPQLELKSGLGGSLVKSDQMILQPDGKMLKMVNVAVSGNFDVGKLVVIPYLRAKGIAKVDTLMVSHEDIDHRGGGKYIHDNIPVANVMSSDPNVLEDVKVESCKSGKKWQWDNVDFEILSPPLNYDQNDNNRSCVLKVSNGYHSLLLTGDIQKVAEKDLLETSPEKLQAEVLSVPHHGSKTSSSPAFIQAVSPKLGLITAGYRSRFGHPKQDVVKRYESRGVTLMNTVDHGAIELSFPNSDKTFKSKSYRLSNQGFWSR